MEARKTILIALLLALAGCSSASKKNASIKNDPLVPGLPPPPAPAGGAAKFPTSSDPIVSTGPSAGAGQAVIAGRVLDEYGRPAANSFIRLVAVSEKEAETPVEIAATPEGYFVIQGLKKGADYKLIARTKAGETLIAGQTQTAAPNIAVVIKMSRDLVGATTPEIPSDLGTRKETPKTTKLGTPEPTPHWKPGLDTASTPATPVPRLSLEPDVPAVKVPVPPASKPDPAFVPGIVDKGATWPPLLVTPPPPPPATPPKSEVKAVPLAPATEPRPGAATGPARVPSCVLVGKQLINFALNDINGEPWEFRTHRKGKLVLLDFWGTHCTYCRPMMPHLRELDAKYRSQGLEILGIAYEHAGTPQEQAYRINAVVQGEKITYRQLLGGGPGCPVKTQFKAPYLPTLVLVDENGWILWRHEGLPSRVHLDELERWIQRRLPAKGTP